MPIFKGDDPDGWAFRAERYFAVNQLTEDKKLELEGEKLGRAKRAVEEPFWQGGKRSVLKFPSGVQLVSEQVAGSSLLWGNSGGVRGILVIQSPWPNAVLGRGGLLVHNPCPNNCFMGLRFVRPGENVAPTV